MGTFPKPWLTSAIADDINHQQKSSAEENGRFPCIYQAPAEAVTAKWHPAGWKSLVSFQRCIIYSRLKGSGPLSPIRCYKLVESKEGKPNFSIAEAFLNQVEPSYGKFTSDPKCLCKARLMPSQESAGVSRPSRGAVLAKRTVTFWLIQEIVRGCNQHTRTPVRVTAYRCCSPNPHQG